MVFYCQTGVCGIDCLRVSLLRDFSPLKDKHYTGRTYACCFWRIILCRKALSHRNRFCKNVKKNLYGSARIRIDRIVYDRYVCCAFGILCLLGLYVLIWRKDLFGIRSKIVSVLFYSIIFAAFDKITAPRLNNQSYVRKYMGMLGTFVKTDAKKLMFSGQVSHGVILFAGLMFAGFLLLFIFMLQKKGISDMRDDNDDIHVIVWL